jgi:hypothetical protein
VVNKFVLVYVFIMSVAVAGSLSADLLNPPPNPWIRVVIRDSAGTTITFSGGDSYHFGWMGMDSGVYIPVSCPLFNQDAESLFLAQEGATYGFYNIEMKVAEVNTPAIVILVKPLDT